MSEIKVDMDISGVVEKTAQLLNLTKKQQAALQSLIVTTSNLTDAGEESNKYVEQQINVNQKLLSVYKLVDGANELISSKIVATNTAINRQRNAFQELATAASRVQLGKIFEGFKGGLTEQEAARVEKIRSSISKLDAELVNPKKIQEYFTAIKGGNIPEATGDLAKLRDELVKLNNVRKASAARTIADASGGLVDRAEELRNRARGRSSRFQQGYDGLIVAPIAQSFGIDPDKLTAKDTEVIRRTGARISKILRDNLAEDKRDIIDTKKLQELIPKLQNTKDRSFINTPEVQAAAEQLGKLITLFERLKNAREAAEKPKGRPADPAKAAAAKSASAEADKFRSVFQNNIVDELSRQFAIPKGDLTIRNAGAIKAASADLAKSIQRSTTGLSTNDILDQFNTLKKGGKFDVPADSEIAKTSAALTRLIGLFERLRQERDRESDTSRKGLDQRLKSQREAAETETRARSIGNSVSKRLRGDSARLAGIDPNLDFTNKADYTKLIRQIGELGQKAGLSQKEVNALYTRLNGGELTAADGKYARLITTFEKLNGLIRKSKDEAASFQKNGITGLDVGPPSPKEKDIGKVKEYNGVYSKIRDSLEYFAVYKGFNFLSNQLSQAFENARKFQVQISLIRTISQDAQQSFGKTQRDLIGVSNRSGIDAAEVAQANYDVVSNQIAKGANAPKFTEKAADLARTTGASLTDSVNILSGAINSYSLDAEEAEVISAKLFKAVDIGKIKIADLSDTLGRVAFVGRDLGVSFDEILGTLATLTQKGITTDDAVTLLTNGMSKLTNPTEKMAGFLKTLGFESGQSAVRILGFAQTMRVLTDAVKDGKLELTDLFNEIRGEKFASAFKTFETDIKKNTAAIGSGSFGDYKNAIDIRGESDADKVNKQINQLKNTLTTSFGNEVTELLKRLIDASGGVENLAKSIDTLAKAAVIGGTAFIAYKGTIFALQLATGAYNAVVALNTLFTNNNTAATRANSVLKSVGTAQTGAQTIAIAQNTAAQRLNNAAFLASPLGLAVAAGAALFAYYQTSSLEVGKFDEKLQTLKDTYDEVIKKQQLLAQDNVFKGYTEDLEKAERALAGLGKVIATDLANANRELEGAKRSSEKTGASLKEGFEKYVNFMRDRISDVSREYNKFDDRIKNSAKSILNVREQARSQLFETNLKYSGGFEFDQFGQREKLLLGEQKRLRTEIRALYDKGGDEDLQKARELNGRLISLDNQRFDVQQDRAQRQLEEAVKANPSQFKGDQYGKVYRGVDPTSLKRDQDANLKFIEALEERAKDRAGIQKTEDEQEKLRRQEGLLKAENAIKELDNVQIFDKSGTVKKEFQNTDNDRVDLGKVRNAFKIAGEKVKKSLDPAALKEVGGDIEKLLKQRYETVEREIEATQAVELLRRKQNQAVESAKSLNKEFKDGQSDIRKYGQEVETVVTKLEALVQGVKNFGGEPLEGLIRQAGRSEGGFGTGTAAQRTANTVYDELSALGKSILESAAPTPGIKESNGETTQSSNQKAKARVKAIQDEGNAIQQALAGLSKKQVDKDGFKAFDPKEVQGILDRVKSLKEKVKGELEKGLGGSNVALPGTPGALSIPALDTLEGALRDQLGKATEGYNKSLGGLDKLRADTNALTGNLNGTLDALAKIGPATQAGLVGASAPVNTLTTEVGKLNLELDATLKKLAGLKLNGPQAPPVIPSGTDKPAGTDFNGNKALGGMLYGAGGGVGSDNQAVYAQAGEYIWNRTATRQFYSQIQAMNGRGRTPVEFHQSSGDTINVGGVTINESKSGQSTASDVLRTLKRQQRRG